MNEIYVHLKWIKLNHNLNRLNFAMKKYFSTGAFFVLVLFSALSCSQVSPTSPIPETSPSSSPEIPYCNQNDATLCLEGFGKEGKDTLLILFQDRHTVLHSLKVQKGGDQSPKFFQCAHSEKFPEYVYCAGDFIQNGAYTKITAYNAQKEILAQGGFTIQQGDLTFLKAEIPQEILSKTPTQNAVERIDNPSPTPTPALFDYPNYPNSPNYPNN